MNLCLDSSVVIDVLRGRTPIYRERLEEAEERGDSLTISSIVLHELVYGAMISADPAKQMARVEALTSRVHVEPWNVDDAMAAARLRAELKRNGNSIGSFDALIAGQALARGWIVVTGNLREFARVHGLSLIDWSISDRPVSAEVKIASLRSPRK